MQLQSEITGFLCTTQPELSTATSLLPLQTSSSSSENDDTPVTFADISRRSLLSIEIGTSEKVSQHCAVARCVYFTLPSLRLSRASLSLRPPSLPIRRSLPLRPRLFQQWAESRGLRMFATRAFSFSLVPFSSWGRSPHLLFSLYLSRTTPLPPPRYGSPSLFGLIPHCG